MGGIISLGNVHRVWSPGSFGVVTSPAAQEEPRDGGGKKVLTHGEALLSSAVYLWADLCLLSLPAFNLLRNINLAGQSCCDITPATGTLPYILHSSLARKNLKGLDTKPLFLCTTCKFSWE